MRKICRFLMFILIFSIISTSLFFNISLVYQKNSEPTREINISGVWKIDHSIHIDNNWSETVILYDWCSGSGTFQDPFRIENVELDGFKETGIIIENSTTYFMLINCSFSNSKYGMIFKNVLHGRVVLSSIFNNDIGIYAKECSDVLVERCNLTNNFYGIKTLDSIESDIGTNIFENCKTAISIENSYGNIIVRNNFIKNFKSINTINNYDSFISDNNFLTNLLEGIYFQDSHTNYISLNTFEGSKNGILLSNSRNNFILNNIINTNSQNGLYLHESRENYIYENIINFSQSSAIIFQRSLANDFINNIIIDNFYGISLTDSSNENQILNNVMERNRIHYNIDSSSLYNNITPISDDEKNIEFLFISFMGLCGVLLLVFISRWKLKSS